MSRRHHRWSAPSPGRGDRPCRCLRCGARRRTVPSGVAHLGQSVYLDASGVWTDAVPACRPAAVQIPLLADRDPETPDPDITSNPGGRP